MPEIKRIPTMRVATVTRVGPFSQSIQDGMQGIFGWLEANQLQPLGQLLAIYPDDPAEVAEENLRVHIGVPVSPDVEPSGEVELRDIGDFEAATTTYEGVENIDRVYGELYQWLQEQGYRDAGDPIEVYLNQPGEGLRAEVYIPIARIEAVELPAPKRAVKKAASKKSAGKKAVRKGAKKSAKKTPKKPARKNAKKSAKRRARK